MKKVLNSFMNEHKDTFNELFNYHIKNKVYSREDYITIINKIHAIYDKYPNIKKIIEDNIYTALNSQEIAALCEVYNLFNQLHKIELLEAYKVGCKDAYIFFEEQDMLNI